MITELLHKALPEHVKEKTAAVALNEAARLGDHPGLEAAVARRGRREADQFGARELGLPQPLRFLTVYDFFDDYLSRIFEVQDRHQEKNWCRFWWDHTSVLHRVESMWRKYEKIRLDDPAGCDEEFLRFVADHHMPILLASTSPMAECERGDNHHDSRRLPSAPREDITHE